MYCLSWVCHLDCVSLSPLQLPHPQGACDQSFVHVGSSNWVICHSWSIWHLFLLFFGCWKVHFGWLLLWFCQSVCWLFVGGLVVGTVSNLHPDTGLLQFIQLTQAPAKGSASWLPSSQRHGLSRGQRGLCWHGSPQPWVPRRTQPRKPVLRRRVLWVRSDTPIWNKKSPGVPLPLCLGEGF